MFMEIQRFFNGVQCHRLRFGNKFEMHFLYIIQTVMIQECTTKLCIAGCMSVIQPAHRELPFVSGVISIITIVSGTYVCIKHCPLSG